MGQAVAGVATGRQGVEQAPGGVPNLKSLDQPRVAQAETGQVVDPGYTFEHAALADGTACPGAFRSSFRCHGFSPGVARPVSADCGAGRRSGVSTAGAVVPVGPAPCPDAPHVAHSPVVVPVLPQPLLPAAVVARPPAQGVRAVPLVVGVVRLWKKPPPAAAASSLLLLFILIAPSLQGEDEKLSGDQARGIVDRGTLSPKSRLGPVSPGPVSPI